MKKVCFVGITNKIGLEAFDSSTKSGEIIHQIISLLDVEAFLMNYVNDAPTNEHGVLRYPTSFELEASYDSFQQRILEINPDLIVVCGKMIAKELKKKNFYQDKVLVIYHPSYIYVYHRNDLESYLFDVVCKIKEIIF